MSVDQSALVVECCRACVFLLGFASGLLFVGLFGRRWFF